LKKKKQKTFDYFGFGSIRLEQYQVVAVDEFVAAAPA